MKALHDMRIAAKRLRYILEVGAEPCFGPYAATAIKRTKDLQDLLGELHDCDVQLPRVRALQDELRAADALEARARAGDAPDLDPTLASGTPHAEAWRGLETLAHLRRGAPRAAVRALPRAVARARARGLPRAPALRDQRATRAADARFHRLTTATSASAAIASPAGSDG